MSLFGRRNEGPAAIDSPRGVEDVTDASGVKRPIPTEITIEAGDEEANGRIGKGSRVVGKLEFAGGVRVYGEVDGEIIAGGAVIIRRGARVHGEVRASEVVIEGDLTADVQATERVEIGATGRLRGTIAAPRVILHEGAIFDGSCSMASATDVEAPRSGVEGDGGGSVDEALSLAS